MPPTIPKDFLFSPCLDQKKALTLPGANRAYGVRAYGASVPH
jgi:hypothetical protein